MLRLAATHAPTLTKQRAPLALLSVLLVHNSIDLGTQRSTTLRNTCIDSALSKTPSIVYVSQGQFWPQVENIAKGTTDPRVELILPRSLEVKIF